MPDTSLVVQESSLQPLFERALSNLREDVAGNSYIREALRVLPVGGYRSAIGCVWNAVVDDLRNKIIHRSLSLFNKSVEILREVKTYEDFQNLVNDDQLIDGAYKIGVIGWEASKVLRHAKETRHIFDGHPRSSDPSIVKVLGMFDDCIRYVLNELFPPQIVDIDEYIGTMDKPEFDRNEFAVANALTELPEIYKSELANRFFTVYVHPNTSSILRSNVEFAAPVLWNALPKETKLQVVRRVDQQITKSDATQTASAFSFVNVVKANAYLSPSARAYLLTPLVSKLKDNLDNWSIENDAARELEPYAANIPSSLLHDYAWGIVHTYVGYVGSSAQYNRRDFYANGAAYVIPNLVKVFDDNAASTFVDVVRKSDLLKRRIESPLKFARLRSLAHLVQERVSSNFGERAFLEALVDESRAEEFVRLLR